MSELVHGKFVYTDIIKLQDKYSKNIYIIAPQLNSFIAKISPMIFSM